MSATIPISGGWGLILGGKLEVETLVRKAHERDASEVLPK